MLGWSAFLMQLNERAVCRSSTTTERFASSESFKMQMTLAEFCLTHFARLCFLISARIELVSPKQTAEWCPLRNLSVTRREIIKTAGASVISAVSGKTSNLYWVFFPRKTASPILRTLLCECAIYDTLYHTCGTRHNFGNALQTRDLYYMKTRNTSLEKSLPFPVRRKFVPSISIRPAS